MALPSGSDNYGKLVAASQSELMNAVASGASLRSIAAQYGVCHQAAAQHLSKHPEFQEARRVGIQIRMETREAELEVAPEQVDVSRARELLAHARWVAERIDPERWGQRTQVTVEIGADLAAALAGARDRVRAALAAPQEKDVSEKPILAEFTQVPDK
mgnify:FL=1